MIFSDFFSRLRSRAAEPASPHPDRLVEAHRVPDDVFETTEDDAIREVNVIATLVLIVLLVAGMVLFFSTASASGPNCPNMPPDWLGWCDASQLMEGR